MSKRTLILILGLALLTAFFMYVAVRQQQSQTPPTQTTQISPTKKPVPAYTTLALSPQILQLSSNSGVLTVEINTGEGTKKNTVTAVQLEMQYDPKALTNVTITPGTFFSNAVPLITNIDKTAGTITYALAIQPTASGKSGKGTLATLQFQILPTASTTTITLLPTTLVTAQGVGESVLKDAVSAKIMTPSQTRTPSATGAAR